MLSATGPRTLVVAPSNCPSAFVVDAGNQMAGPPTRTTARSARQIQLIVSPRSTRVSREPQIGCSTQVRHEDSLSRYCQRDRTGVVSPVIRVSYDCNDGR